MSERSKDKPDDKVEKPRSENTSGIDPRESIDIRALVIETLQRRRNERLSPERQRALDSLKKNTNKYPKIQINWDDAEISLKQCPEALDIVNRLIERGTTLIMVDRGEYIFEICEIGKIPTFPYDDPNGRGNVLYDGKAQEKIASKYPDAVNKTINAIDSARNLTTAEGVTLGELMSSDLHNYCVDMGCPMNDPSSCYILTPPKVRNYNDIYYPNGKAYICKNGQIYEISIERTADGFRCMLSVINIPRTNRNRVFADLIV